MRLSSLEFCGFRGFRVPLRLEFGRGFTVISGRNGVGKSTIFDAIEFALTGEIDKYRVEKAGKESIQDYIWWRGAGQPPSGNYVCVEFIGDDGSRFSVTRTRKEGADKSAAEIEAVLCHAGKPEHALRQLCRTSIIRDELIAALSLDLSETERFDLVRTALGAIEGPGYSAKAKELVAITEAHASQAHRNYEIERVQLGSELTHLSQVRDRAARSGDLAAAMSTLSAELGAEPADLARRIAAARESLAGGRIRLARLNEVVREAYEVVRQASEFESAAYKEVKQAVVVGIERAKERDEVSRKAVVDAELALVKEQQSNAMATAIIAMAHAAEHVGLNDGRCPLCAAERSQDEFAAGVAAARARAEKFSGDLVEAQRRFEEATRNAHEPSLELQGAQLRLSEIQTAEAAFETRRQAYLERLSQLGMGPQWAAEPEKLEKSVESERERYLHLERAVLTLEASQAVELVTNIEARVVGSRTRASQSETSMTRARAAHVSAKDIAHAVARTSAEIVDERLALISPLLNELYARLRPHADWRSIEYSVRGDVRRFLSLRVGDDLNPQFIFSSGQRRAAGLAFLLSVHLSRAWSGWKTLLLDDPVQHIDDFRAVHLVEVLAALRMDGRQLVCAVEDSQLADLLCRRLISTSEEPGIRYDLAYEPTGGVAFAMADEVSPLGLGMLRRVETRTG